MAKTVSHAEAIQQLRDLTAKIIEAQNSIIEAIEALAKELANHAHSTESE